MSLVGPRPERPELQKEIEKEVPEFGLRLQAKCLRYIIDEYSKLENQELKEDFMCKWIDCLTLVESMGDEYKEVYAQNMMRVCQDIIREEYEVLNPVWRNYFSLCVKYKCGLETK